MQDRQSLNDHMQLPKRYSAHPKEEVRTKHLLTHIARTKKPETETTNAETPTKTTTQDPAEQETTSRTDEVIYADDTNMITEQDTVPRISKKLQNYSTVTYSRNVNINWGKVDIVARKKEHGGLIAGLPPPFNKVKIADIG